MDAILFAAFALLTGLKIGTREGRFSCLRSVEHNCIEGSSLKETEMPC